MIAFLQGSFFSFLKLQAVQGHIFLYGIHHSQHYWVLVSFFFPISGFAIDCTVTEWAAGQRGKCTFLSLKICFCWKGSSAERNKNEAIQSVLHWKCLSPKNDSFLFYYRFITLEYSSFLPLWDNWNHQVTTSFCIKRLSGVVSVVVSLLSRGNCPLSGVCRIGTLKYLSGAEIVLLLSRNKKIGCIFIYKNCLSGCFPGQLSSKSLISLWTQDAVLWLLSVSHG